MERVAEQFRLDVRQAFEKENADWRAEEEDGIAKVKADPMNALKIENDPNFASAMTVRDSFYWEIYERSTIDVKNNSVRVILPRGFAIYADFIRMFEETSVGWSKADVDAEIVDGTPRVVIKLILIDYWDADRAAKWLAEKALRVV